MRPIYLVLSCEHAGNKIPVDYGKYFDKAFDILNTHRGLDLGVMKIAQTYADEFGVSVFSTNVSRLLVDCNRSIGNLNLFSVFTESLDQVTKTKILDQYYHPYRQQVINQITKLSEKGQVLHLSIHTFTPELKGEVRPMDIGLLFDEQRTTERELCVTWQQHILQDLSDSTMLNAPYSGADDGFTTHLRKSYGQDQYMGIELEVNQKWVGLPYIDTLVQTSISSLRAALTAKGYELVS